MTQNRKQVVLAPIPDVPRSAPSIFAPAATGLTFAATLETANTTHGIGSTSSEHAASAKPGWLADIVMARNQDVFSPSPQSKGELLMSSPSMFAPAAAGLALQTWRYGIPNSRTNPRAVRSVAVARPRTALPGQTPPEQTLLERITGTVRPPTPQSATHAQPAIGNRSQSNANTPGPSLMATDQPRQRKKPATEAPRRAATSSDDPPQPKPQ